MTALESQCHFELTLSYLDNHLDDVETNTNVLTEEVEFIKE